MTTRVSDKGLVQGFEQGIRARSVHTLVPHFISIRNRIGIKTRLKQGLRIMYKVKISHTLVPDFYVHQVLVHHVKNQVTTPLWLHATVLVSGSAFHGSNG